MVNKKVIIISLLILILMSVQFVSANDNTDIKIGDNGDNGVLQAPNLEKNVDPNTIEDAQDTSNSDSGIENITNLDDIGDDASINVNSDEVDLSLTKTVNSTEPYVDDIIVYTITVSNNGNNTATGVLVYEDLLDGLEYISDDSKGEYFYNLGIWDISYIAPGETKILNILVKVTKAMTITNYAIVIADQEIKNIDESYDIVTINAVEHDKNETGDTNETGDDTSIHQKDGNIRLKETGNPLMVLIIVLLSVYVSLRQKKH